jgi:hypothetical protein
METPAPGENQPDQTRADERLTVRQMRKLLSAEKQKFEVCIGIGISEGKDEGEGGGEGEDALRPAHYCLLHVLCVCV